MHWFSSRITEVGALSERFSRSRLEGGATAPSEARHAFLNDLSMLTVEVAAREGVTACIVAHDGLVLARAGHPVDDEALAATSQACVAAARTAGTALSLGPVRQMVLVGEESKLALFVLGPMAVGVLAPAGVSLSRALG